MKKEKGSILTMILPLALILFTSLGIYVYNSANETIRSNTYNSNYYNYSNSYDYDYSNYYDSYDSDNEIDYYNSIYNSIYDF